MYCTLLEGQKMDFLLCPACKNQPLMLRGDHRTCGNCEYSMDEVQYQVYAAQCMDRFNKEYDALQRKELRDVRKSFGQKKPKTATLATSKKIKTAPKATPKTKPAAKAKSRQN